METLFHRAELIVRLAELSLVREAAAYEVLDSDERPIGWISQDVGSVGSVLSRLPQINRVPTITFAVRDADSSEIAHSLTVGLSLDPWTRLLDGVGQR